MSNPVPHLHHPATPEPIPFRNIMVNVQLDVPVGRGRDIPIIGELQLTTIASVKIKKVQHKTEDF